LYNEVIVLGIIISMVYTELTGLSAGLIIPGYLALSLHSPVRLIYTFAVAGAAVGLCRLLSRVVILYGRRRFALLIVLTFALIAGADILNFVPGGRSVIGILIPGILAREMDRQGFVDSMLSIAVTTGVLALILTAIGYPVFGM